MSTQRVGMYAVLAEVRPAASHAIRRGNYERLLDSARIRVRAWERADIE